MHYIQRKILNNLLYAEYLNYARMRPEGVESNHFAYHLEQLIKDGLVAKRDKQYFLTPQGLAFVDRLSQEKMVGRTQPHIITAVSVTSGSGRTLLYRRNFQPYINMLGFPLGKVHLEESIGAAAARELQEKTGLTDIPLTQRGVVYIHVTRDGITITKALYHVFTGNVRGEPPVAAPTNRGSCSWVDITQLTPAQIMPGFLDIKRLLQNDKPDMFFAELSYELG